MDRLKSIMSKIFRVPQEKITDEATMKDVPGWDSLTHIDLILFLEKEFNIRLTGEDIAEMRNVKAIKEILHKYGVN